MNSVHTLLFSERAQSHLGTTCLPTYSDNSPWKVIEVVCPHSARPQALSSSGHMRTCLGRCFPSWRAPQEDEARLPSTLAVFFPVGSSQAIVSLTSAPPGRLGNACRSSLPGGLRGWEAWDWQENFALSRILAPSRDEGRVKKRVFSYYIISPWLRGQIKIISNFHMKKLSCKGGAKWLSI